MRASGIQTPHPFHPLRKIRSSDPVTPSSSSPSFDVESQAPAATPAFKSSTGTPRSRNLTHSKRLTQPVCWRETSFAETVFGETNSALLRKEIVLIVICACDSTGFSGVASKMGEWGAAMGEGRRLFCRTAVPGWVRDCLRVWHCVVVVSSEDSLLMRVVAATVTTHRTRAAKKIPMSVPISGTTPSRCSCSACCRISTEMRKASLTGTPSDAGVDQTWATHVLRLVFSAAKSWGVSTFSERIHDSPETARRARRGVTWTSLEVASVRIVTGAVARRCSMFDTVGDEM